MLDFLIKIPAPAWLISSALFFALGEYFSKLWGNTPSLKGAVYVVVAYAFGSIFWLPALLHKNQLAIMGTAWLLLATVATAVIGVFIFGESLTNLQWVGLGLAAAAILLLSW
jgi:multidrug transporter EmrE-like cation transporter